MLCLLVFSHSVFADVDFIYAAPEGFVEDNIDIPTQVQASIFFNSSLLGNFYIVQGSEELSFTDPEGVLSAVDSIKPDLYNELLVRMQGKFLYNQHLLCIGSNTADCGFILNPHHIEIIYDLVNYNIYLFINKKYLDFKEPREHRVRHIEPFSHGFSAIFNTAGSLYAQSGAEEQYSLSIEPIISNNSYKFFARYVNANKGL